MKGTTEYIRSSFERIDDDILSLRAELVGIRDYQQKLKRAILRSHYILDQRLKKLESAMALNVDNLNSKLTELKTNVDALIASHADVTKAVAAAEAAAQAVVDGATAQVDAVSQAAKAAAPTA